MIPLIHTLTVSILRLGDNIPTVYTGNDAVALLNYGMRFSPSTDRENGAHFTMEAPLSPHTTLRVQMQFWRKFLHVGHFNFSPDRGLLVPGGLLSTVRGPWTRGTCGSQGNATSSAAGASTHPIVASSFTGGGIVSTDTVYLAPSRYVMFALPDLSPFLFRRQPCAYDASGMPFNVIAISTTVLMLFFGSIFQMTAARPLEKGSQPPVVKLLNLVTNVIRRYLRL